MEVYIKNLKKSCNISPNKQKNQKVTNQQLQSLMKEQPQTKMKKIFYLSISEQVKYLGNNNPYMSNIKLQPKIKLGDKQNLLIKMSQNKIYSNIQNPALAQEMLQKKIYLQASTTLKNTVIDIQDKFRDKEIGIIYLACVQPFNQLSTLVFAQGQKIDNIEENVTGTKYYIQKAEESLKKLRNIINVLKSVCIYFQLSGWQFQQLLLLLQSQPKNDNLLDSKNKF